MTKHTIEQQSNVKTGWMAHPINRVQLALQRAGKQGVWVGPIPQKLKRRPLVRVRTDRYGNNIIEIDTTYSGSVEWETIAIEALDKYTATR